MSLLDDLLEQEDLYLTEFPQGWTFLWRLLTLDEYRKFRSLRASGLFHPFFIHWKVFEKCYQGKTDLLNQTMPMGIPLSIGELILYLSGDCEAVTIKDELTALRAAYGEGDLTEVMKRTIMLAFPTYGPDDFGKKSRSWVIRRFVEAEAMLALKAPGYKPMDTAKIFTSSELEQQRPKKNDPVMQPINFDMENVAIKKQISPWDQAEVNERDYEAEQAKKKTKKLTPEQARELDRRQRRR